MKMHHEVTRHARARSSARTIPPMIAEIILEFGQSCDAGVPDAIFVALGPAVAAAVDAVLATRAQLETKVSALLSSRSTV